MTCTPPTQVPAPSRAIMSIMPVCRDRVSSTVSVPAVRMAQRERRAASLSHEIPDRELED